MIVSDNGTEFTSTAILAWAEDHRVAWQYIAPGKPIRNGFVESAPKGVTTNAETQVRAG